MKLPENKEYVAKETDTDAAVKAAVDLNQDPTQPLLNITTANITGMRNTLGIPKFKPEKPADPPATVDLATLQKQFEATKIEANSTREVVNQLISHVRYLQLVILQNAPLLSALPETTMAQFKDLRRLDPLPTS
jgi:hypothetical protein